MHGACRCRMAWFTRLTDALQSEIKGLEMETQINRGPTDWVGEQEFPARFVRDHRVGIRRAWSPGLDRRPLSALRRLVGGPRFGGPRFGRPSGPWRQRGG